MTAAATTHANDAFSGLVGQQRAIAELRAALASPGHAYLFVGPAGVGKHLAARVFAGELLALGLDDAAAERSRRLAREGHHPDLTIVERTGATVVAAQAEEIVRTASLSPVEGDRKVLLLPDFHLVEAAAAPKLLKTIEEPPAGTHFVILAEDISPDLITIASRCNRIDFSALSEAEVTEALLASGVDLSAAERAAQSARGNLERARLLATDPNIENRRQAWRGVPGTLDGTGSQAAALVDELLELITDAQLPLGERHDKELVALAEREEEMGTRGSGRKDLETRQKREARRHRTDELRFGLAELAAVYRDRLGAGDHRSANALHALDAITEAERALIRNPNETLMLQALLIRLGRLL